MASVTKNPTLGQSFVSPSLSFNAAAQAVSNKPAMTRMTQAMSFAFLSAENRTPNTENDC